MLLLVWALVLWTDTHVISKASGIAKRVIDRNQSCRNNAELARHCGVRIIVQAQAANSVRDGDDIREHRDRRPGPVTGFR